MRGIVLKDRAGEIVDALYTAYGTDTGILFGISAERKVAVRLIIELVLEREERCKEQP